MKVKTSELTGVALDWAVAKCEGYETLMHKGQLNTLFTDNGWSPSTNWALGGEIIEREVICIGSGMDAPTWYANKGLGKYHQFGKTPLIAAMRCCVASKLGAEVELPTELTQGEMK